MIKLINLKVLLIIGIAVLAILFYFQRKHINNLKESVNNKQTIIENKENTYQTDSGRWVSEINTWKVKSSDLKDANENYKRSLEDKNYKISEQERQLGKLYNTIEEQNIRMKDLKSANAASMETINDLKTRIGFVTDSLGNLVDVKIDTIKTKHLRLSFKFVPPDSLDVNHVYKNTISTLVIVRSKRKENGEKHWPFGNWKWLWGRETITSVTTEDKNAKITNNVSVEIK